MKEKVLSRETTTDADGNVVSSTVVYDTGLRMPDGTPIIGWNFCSEPGISIVRKKYDKSNDPDLSE